jgi:MFS transporter, DHA1 family, inner membrane transport protein
MDADVPMSGARVAEGDAPLPVLRASALDAAAQRRVQVAICLSAFLAALNFFAPTPFYPQMARDLATTVPLLGQVVTLMALLSAGLGLLIGPLADRYGFRRPLALGLLAIAVTLGGTGLAPTYPVLLALGAVGGVGDAVAFALPFAIAATVFEGDTRRRTIGWAIAAMSTAPIVGVPVLTAIGGVSGWRVALIVAGAAAAAVAIFVAVALPADHRRPATPFRGGAIGAAYGPLLRHPPTLRLLAVSALRGMWWVGLLTYLGAFLGTAVGLSARNVGIAYALAGGGYALGSVAAGGRLGAVSPRTAVGVASLIAGVLLAPMLAAPAAWLVYPLLLAISFAGAVSSVGVVTLLAAESPAGAGTTMVLNGTVLNVGTAGGAVFCGLLIAVGGYAALAVGLPGFAVLAALLAWWPARR